MITILARPVLENRFLFGASPLRGQWYPGVYLGKANQHGEGYGSPGHLGISRGIKNVFFHSWERVHLAGPGSYTESQSRTKKKKSFRKAGFLLSLRKNFHFFFSGFFQTDPLVSNMSPHRS